MRTFRYLLSCLLFIPAVTLASDWQCSAAVFAKGQNVRTQDTLQQAEVDGCRTVAGKRVYQVYAFGSGSREIAEERLIAVEAFQLQDTIANPPLPPAVASNP